MATINQKDPEPGREQ